MEKHWILLWIIGLCVIGMGSLLGDIIVGNSEENSKHIISNHNNSLRKKSHDVYSDQQLSDTNDYDYNYDTIDPYD